VETSSLTERYDRRALTATPLMRFKRGPTVPHASEQGRDSLTRCALPRSGWHARPRREDARITDARVSGYADGLRHGGEDLEPRVKASEAENGGHQGRGGSQAQDTAQKPGAAGDANQHGKPARIAEGHPRQIDDQPAGTRPQQAEKLLTQHGCARDVDFTADRQTRTPLDQGGIVLDADDRPGPHLWCVTWS
jgi:hypothetical protein